jgi:hypothetical protein
LEKEMEVAPKGKKCTHIEMSRMNTVTTMQVGRESSGLIMGTGSRCLWKGEDEKERGFEMEKRTRQYMRSDQANEAAEAWKNRE